jgi:DNA repair exonuclease SbcCD ATPase subunit
LAKSSPTSLNNTNGSPAVVRVSGNAPATDNTSANYNDSVTHDSGSQSSTDKVLGVSKSEPPQQLQKTAHKSPVTAVSLEPNVTANSNYSAVNVQTTPVSAINDTVSLLTGEKNELLAKISLLERSNQELKQWNSSYQASIAQLKSSLQELEKESKEFSDSKSKFSNLEQEYRNLLQTCSELKERNGQLSERLQMKAASPLATEDYSSLLEKYNQLESVQSSREARIEKLIDEREDLLVRIDVLSQDKKNLKQEYDTRLQEQETFKEELQQQLISLTQEFKKSESQAKDMHSKYQKVLDENASLTQQLEELSEKYQQSSTESDRLKSVSNEATSLNSELAASRQEAVAFKQKLNQKNQEFASIQQENRSLFEQLEELREHVVNLTNKNALIVDDLESSRRKALYLEKKLEEHKHEHHDHSGHGHSHAHHNHEGHNHEDHSHEHHGHDNHDHGHAEHDHSHEHGSHKSENVQSNLNDNLVQKLEQEKNSLQEKLQNSMQEYAQLRYQLERVTHLNEQLLMEAETVPQYIEKYHEERRVLKAKSLQKDRLIQKLVSQHQELLKSMTRVKTKEENSKAIDSGVDLIRTAVDVMNEENEQLQQLDSRIQMLHRLSIPVPGGDAIFFVACKDCRSDLIEL